MNSDPNRFGGYALENQQSHNAVGLTNSLCQTSFLFFCQQNSKQCLFLSNYKGVANSIYFICFFSLFQSFSRSLSSILTLSVWYDCFYHKAFSSVVCFVFESLLSGEFSWYVNLFGLNNNNKQNTCNRRALWFETALVFTGLGHQHQ